MKAEEIRQIISGVNPSLKRARQRQIKKKINSALFTLKSAVVNKAEMSAENAIWLQENYRLLTKYARKITSEKLYVTSFVLDVSSNIISNNDFEGTDSEFQTIYEAITAAKQCYDRELISIKAVFLFQILLELEKSVIENSNHIQRYIKLFHSVNSKDFTSLNVGFSPIEQMLRYDPSGTYSGMTRKTQLLYRRWLKKEAKKKGYTEEKYCDVILNQARKDKRHIGYYFLPKKQGYWYFIVLFSLYFVLLITFALASDVIFLIPLVAFPLYFFVKSLTDFAFSFILQHDPLPSVKIEKIDENNKTAVIITALICREKDVDIIFEKLHCYQLNNRQAQDQIYFGLLCDWKESKKKTEQNDEKLLQYLKKKTDEYNEIIPCYFICWRDRVFHKSEESFVGWERKRGAVHQFISLIKTEKEEKDFHWYGSKCFSGIKYIITLDADTELGLGQAKRLVGIAEHPLNRPITGQLKGRKCIIDGFGIIQPAIATTLAEKTKTPYGKLFGNGSGELPYATAAFDIMQNLFGEGNFCGKGLIHVDSYYEVFKEALPEQKILSHDMPEGAFLRCGFAGDEFFLDSNPQNSISHYQRLHRWIRGDFQNFVLLKKFSPLRAWSYIENLCRYLVPASEFFLLFLSCFLEKPYVIVSALLIILFHFQSVFISAFHLLLTGNLHTFSRRFATKIRNVILNSVFQSAYSIAAIAHETVYFLDAIMRSVFRMCISKKKLLQWQVYSPFHNKKNDLIFYFPSILLSIFFLFFVKSVLCLVIVISWIFYPLISAYLGIPFSLKKTWSVNEKKKMFSLLENEFCFFQQCVSEKTSFLPPDNIQFYPTEAIAMRTSPTNIGLYFVSLCIASEFNIISRTEACKRLTQALNSIESMEHYEGHLYNWYELNRLSVIGERFVSTVDSGNYAACLAVTSQCLSEWIPSEAQARNVKMRIDKELSGIQFSALFHYEKNLFYVGIYPDEKQNLSHYDLYMSEARITSYMAIADGQISPSHWASLSRPLLSYCGRCGVGSWSGTCFEYFMPALFLPVVENSLEDESLSYAYYCQKKFATRMEDNKRVFGISESGYSLSDENGIYQYKAFGVPYLALNEKQSHVKVISPYASFLMLRQKERAILNNLEILKDMGVYDNRFGYLEAVDFNTELLNDFTIIYSCMSHHKGMSILALANELKDNFIVEKFLSYHEFKSKISLLSERFPIEGKIEKRKKVISRENTKSIARKQEIISYGQDKKIGNMQTDGNVTLLCYDNGDNRVLWKDNEIFDIKNGGIRVTIKTNGEIISLKSKEIDKAKVVFGGYFTEYKFPLKKGVLLLRFELLSGKNAILVKTHLQGVPNSCEVIYSFSPIIQKYKTFSAHPAFSSLSLEAKKENNVLTIRRRGELNHKYLKLEANSNFNVLMYQRNYKNNFSYEALLTPSIDVCFLTKGQNENQTALIMSFSESDSNVSYFEYLDGNFMQNKFLHNKGIERILRLNKICHYDFDCIEIEKKLYIALEQGKRFLSSKKLIFVERNFLWKFGISGDAPIVSIYVTENERELDMASVLMRVHKKMHISGLEFDLVILNHTENGYFAPLREQLTDMVREYQCDFLIGKPNGIHFVRWETDDELKTFFVISKLTFYYPENEFYSFRSKTLMPQINLQSGTGGETVCAVSKNGIQIDKIKYNPVVPFSHIVSDSNEGFVCNQNSLGFTWFRNSGLNRLSQWDNLPNKTDGEKLFLQNRNGCIDLLSNSDKVSYCNRAVIYEGKINNSKYLIFATVSKEFSGKIINIILDDSLCEKSKLLFTFVPALGKCGDRTVLIKEEKNGYSLVGVPIGEYCGGAFVGILAKERSAFQWNDRMVFSFSAKKENTIMFSGFSCEKHLSYLLEKAENTDYSAVLLKEKETAEEILSQKQNSPQQFWAHYQAIYSRFLARTGLYQSSGAYGFRDQLQDSLVFLNIDWEITRRHILRAASHQFEEGDVQHWWHPLRTNSMGNAGIRSCCSDDYLWLLYVTSEYINKTGDTNILNVKVPFIKGEQLSEDIKEKYFIPTLGESGTLAEHLKRGIQLLLKRNLLENNLPPIGNGDWNDGMNRIDGESVWLGFFAAICLQRTKHYFSSNLQEEVNSYLKLLKKGLQSAFNGSWFCRAYTKEGKILGNDISLEDECSIDLITQAFSAFYQIEFFGTEFSLDDKNIVSALKSAYHILYSKNIRTTALFTKPFVNSETSPGYIQRYCAGVRENGGQYTHATVWFGLSLLEYGEKINNNALIDMGIEIAESIDPFYYLPVSKFKKYRREPYVLCGDVYTAKGLEGHGGWSWYTGAAGWYCQLLKKKEQVKVNRLS